MTIDVSIVIMTTINHSLEWSAVQLNLEKAARQMKKYDDQMLKVSQNIGRMVAELSKEEVNCRRQNRQTQRHRELLAKINKEIASYEQMLTFGVLLNG